MPSRYSGNGPEMSAFPTSITLSHTTALGTIIYTPVLTSMSGTFSLTSSGEFAIDINSGKSIKIPKKTY